MKNRTNKWLKQLLVAGACLSATLLSAQIVGMPYWALPPNTYKTNISTPTVTALPAFYSSTCGASNGAYDDSGNLIFYVYADGTVGEIIDAAGNYALLPTYTTSSSYAYNLFGPEIAVVPVPGQCKKYYVIYYLYGTGGPGGGGGGGGIVHGYVTVDCNTSTMSVSSLTLLNTSGALGSGNGGGIAVSKLVAGSTRYLFTSDGANIMRYTISSSGIATTGTVIVAQSTISSASLQYIQELILSPNQQYLAWPVAAGSGTNGVIGQVNLNSSYTYNSANYTYLVPSSSGMTYGLEYVSNSTKMLVCTENGLYYLTPGATPGVTAISGTSNKSHTQLRMCNNGTLGFDNSGYMFKISGSFSVTSSICSTPSICRGPGVGPFTTQFYAPDQVEGESYSHFSGVPLSVCNFTINGTVVKCYDDNGTPLLQVYNCNPITVNDLSTNATSYTVQIESTDATETPISGTGLLGTYNSGPLSVCPTDLRSLPGTNGTWLASNPGYYNVTITTDNGCGLTSSHCGWIQVNGSPGAVSINLHINNGLTGISCITKTLPGCPAGEYSASFNLGGSSTSTMSYYRINVDEVDCSTGALISNVYTGANVAYTGQALTGLALNALVIGGSTGYFTTKIGHCYKLTAFVGNACGEASDWSYLKIDGAYRLANPNLPEEAAALAVYPNPDNGQFTVHYSVSGPAVFELYDARGLKVAAYALNPAAQELVIDEQQLSDGVYMYSLKENGASQQSGRLVIVH